jgi:hypothetical protein
MVSMNQLNAFGSNLDEMFQKTPTQQDEDDNNGTWVFKNCRFAPPMNNFLQNNYFLGKTFWLILVYRLVLQII